MHLSHEKPHTILIQLAKKNKLSMKGRLGGPPPRAPAGDWLRLQVGAVGEAEARLTGVEGCLGEARPPPEDPRRAGLGANEGKAWRVQGKGFSVTRV